MLWGAFNNASAAMQVFTTDLGSISQNIANVNTTGYKRQEMMFSTVMSEHKATPTSYLNGLNIFSVQATQRNLIDAQGVITPSTTWSDLAINGQGFFMVARPTAGTAATTAGAAGAGATNVPTSFSTDDPGSVLYTRAGAWSRAYGPDTDPTLARSYFLSGDGSYLLGWMADDTGTIPANATLQPVYTLTARPIANNGTAAVDATSTSDPTAITMPGRATTAASIIANLPRDSSVGGNTSTLTVQDALGNDQTVTLTWERTGAYTYTVIPSTSHGTFPAGTAWDVEVDSTGAVISPTSDPTVDIDWDATGGGATTFGTAVSVSSPPTRGDVHNIPISVFDENYTEHTVTLRFERTGNNQWYMFADAGTDATATPDPVEVTFDGNGKMISPADGLFNGSFSWTSGTETGSATVDFDMSAISQYDDDDLFIKTTSQDGYARGTLLSTTFNEQGELRGYYDNGRTRTLFKVPVANFVADNALEAVSGTMFRRTAAAGELTVSAIEDAPGASSFATSSLENSTVEVEDEFTRMIMTQKAYSMNSKVFQTADDMTTVVRDLKR